MHAYLSGMLLGFGLIVAIGAQNAFVIRQGLRREHHLVVAAVCFTWDALLISLGVVGIGGVIKKVPWLITGFKWVGVVFIATYALLAFRRAFQKEALKAGKSGKKASWQKIARTTFAFSALNPHVYLDTFFLLGVAAASFASPGNYYFGAGAVTVSCIWFFGISLAAAKLAPVLSSPRAWSVIEFCIGTIMSVMALQLAEVI